MNPLFVKHCKPVEMLLGSIPFGVVFVNSGNYETDPFSHWSTEILPSLVYNRLISYRIPIPFSVTLQDTGETFTYVYDCGDEQQPYVELIQSALAAGKKFNRLDLRVAEEGERITYIRDNEINEQS